MKVSHRSALTAAGLAAALAASAATSVLGAQMRPQGPGPDTKRAVVTTFRGDPQAGAKLADEIRNRITGDFNIRVQITSDDMQTPVTKEEPTRVYADR